MKQQEAKRIRTLDDINAEAEAQISAIRRIQLAERERLAHHLEMTEGVGALL